MLKLADGTEMTGLWDNGNQLQIEYNMDLHEPGEESKTNAETEAETQNSENGEELQNLFIILVSIQSTN